MPVTDDRADEFKDHERLPGESEADAELIEDAEERARTEQEDLAGVAERVMTDPRTGKPYPSRSRVFLTGLRSSAMVCLQAILVFAFLWVLFWILGKFWVIVLPVLLAIIVATVLWPPVRFMRKHKVPAALASILALLGTAGVVAGVLALVVPSVIDQTPELANHAVDGIKQVQEWVQGPPLNIDDSQISGFVDTIVHRLQSSATTIASGVYTGVGAATSVLVTLFTALVLVFFFLKDGPKFIPWLNRTVGAPTGSHIAEVLVRMWNTLGGFIRTQAIVSAVDAVLIGIGLFILNVPLWGVLMIFTFIGGFIPIVGAFVAGALAVLIALVANGLTTALIVLGIILLVQQLEGNVLQPWLQAKAMELHAAIVLLAVMLGGSLFGIIGAFLAVPAASCLTVLLRYVLEQIGLAAGEKIQQEDALAGVGLTADENDEAPEKKGILHRKKPGDQGGPATG
ncbi:AI-2E family transporter [Gordonia iterans]|uniref:AI-2E family transporter n=2 Tax=Gordonia iterans TaxID=1004901 RepID=A0A2S0KI83_9ACTN|nr:AI-2E family transporter [Gordonia iterans]